MPIIIQPALTVPVYDSVGAAASVSGFTPSWSHTLGTNANAIIVVVSVVSTGTITGVTAQVGVTTVPALTSVTAGTSLKQALYIFGLLAPPTGAQTIAVTVTGTVNSFVTANSIAYRNVLGFGTGATNSAASTTATLSVPAAPGQLAVAAFSGQNASGSFSAFNQTSRWNQAWSGTGGEATVFGEAPGAVSTSFTTTAPASDTLFCGVGVPLL